MSKQQEILSWVERHPCVESWLNRLSPSSKFRYQAHAYSFFGWVRENGGEFAGKSPEELLNLQDQTSGRERYRQLSLIQRWVNLKKGRFNTKKLAYHAIRSFYLHNHVELPRDVAFKIKGDAPSVDASLTIEDLKKIVLSSNKMYQAVFLCMFQGAMGEQEFEYFNMYGWKQIEPQLAEGKRRLKIHIPGRKHTFMKVNNFYTLIGKDGTEALKSYLNETRGPVRTDEPIFLGERGEPLSKVAIKTYFHRHAVKAGVIKQKTPPCPKCYGETLRRRIMKKGQQKLYYVCSKCGEETPAGKYKKNYGTRYGVSPHEMRDLFRSEWDLSSGKSVCAEFFMGHDIDPNMYNKIMKLHPDWAEAQYALAEPYLNILSEEPRKVSVDRVRELEEKVATLKGEKNGLLERVQELEAQTATLMQEKRTTDQILESPEITALLKALRKPEVQEAIKKEMRKGD